MHSPGDSFGLSPADKAYAIERGRQLVAASRDPNARELLAKQIFADAFASEAPLDAVRTRAGVAMHGHARRATVPDPPAPPQVYANDADTQLEQQRWTEEVLKRVGVIADNERKLRALLWARAVFLETDPEGDYGHTLESAIREWFLCTLPELPTDISGMEQCVKANARASWSTLQRVARERISAAA